MRKEKKRKIKNYLLGTAIGVATAALLTRAFRKAYREVYSRDYTQAGRDVWKKMWEKGGPGFGGAQREGQQARWGYSSSETQRRIEDAFEDIFRRWRSYYTSLYDPKTELRIRDAITTLKRYGVDAEKITKKKEFFDAHKNLALKYHPDVNPTGAPHMAAINSAFNTLKETGWLNKLAATTGFFDELNNLMA